MSNINRKIEEWEALNLDEQENLDFETLRLIETAKQESEDFLSFKTEEYKL